MKTFYKTAFTAIAAALIFVSCGNAGAKTAEKKEKTEDKSVIELNSKTFNEKVYSLTEEDLIFLGDKPAIVDFTASWCGPCQRIAPILEELAKEYKGQINIYKVDIDKERGLAQSFNISSVPAVLYIPTGGKEPIMTVGARNKEKFTEEIKTFLLEK